MSADKKAKPDVRFRPFRVAMYATYLVVVGSFSVAVIVSVVRSVIAMSPRRPQEVEQVLTARECLDQAEALWRELDARRRSLTERAPASRVDEEWASFRVQWLQRHRQIEATCAVDSKDRQAVREVYRRLDQAMDLYTTHAIQYAGEVGPTIDALRESLRAARSGATP